MNRTARVAVGIITITISFVAGFGLTYFSTGGNSTMSGKTTTTTTTIARISPGNNSILVSAYRSCTVTAEGNLILTIVNDSFGAPISSVPVRVEYVGSVCSVNQNKTVNLGIASTNGSGVITICCELGDYYFHVNYIGSYTIIGSIWAERATCIRLGIPNGEVTILHSAPFQTACYGRQ